MTEAALSRLSRFVAEDALDADAETLAALRDGVIDTLGCIHAGVETDVADLAPAHAGENRFQRRQWLVAVPAAGELQQQFAILPALQAEQRLRGLAAHRPPVPLAVPW